MCVRVVAVLIEVEAVSYTLILHRYVVVIMWELTTVVIVESFSLGELSNEKQKCSLSEKSFG